MTLAIETTDLTRYFDEQCAVDKINLAVEQGAIYGFLGPNGAGKSTSIKMLTGILAPSSGGIKLLGLNPWDNNDAIAIKQRTGVVPEDLYQMDPATIRNRSDELLDLLQLVDVEKKLTVEYSHGMKKKTRSPHELSAICCRSMWGAVQRSSSHHTSWKSLNASAHTWASSPTGSWSNSVRWKNFAKAVRLSSAFWKRLAQRRNHRSVWLGWKMAREKTLKIQPKQLRLSQRP